MKHIKTLKAAPPLARRKVLLGAATGMAASALSAPALGSSNRRLAMVTAWPAGFPGLATSANRLAKTITAATDGALDIQVFAAGERVGGLEAFDAVSRGDADLYHQAEYYQQSKHRAFNFFTAVPFGLTAPEMAAWIHFGGGQEIWDEVSAGFNIKPFMTTSTGTQMGGWFKRRINALEDFKDLRIRMPGLGGEVLSQLGAIPTNVPGSEIYDALKTNQLDAAEWIGPWNDLSAGLHEVATHYHYPGFHEAGPVLSMGINMSVWNSFTATQQVIVKAVADAENSRSLAEFNIRNAAALKTLKQDHGITPLAFPDAALKHIAHLSEEHLADVARSDPLTTKTYDSYMAARKALVDWSMVGEGAYIRARALASVVTAP